MPAYNFQLRFVAALQGGSKRSTIRRRAAKPGQTAYLFTGMRTKACVALGEGLITRCTAIEIGIECGTRKCMLGKKFFTAKKFEQLAAIDGFSSAVDMYQWFVQTYGDATDTMTNWRPVFTGYLIEWDPTA